MTVFINSRGFMYDDDGDDDDDDDYDFIQMDILFGGLS